MNLGDIFSLHLPCLFFLSQFCSNHLENLKAHVISFDSLFGHPMQHMGSWFSQLGTEPVPLHWKRSFHHWTTMEVPFVLVLRTYCAFLIYGFLQINTELGMQ